MQVVQDKEMYELRTGKYASGDLSLKIMDSEGSAVAELSLDLPCITRSPSEIILKIYGENQEIARKMIKAKVITPTPRHILVGDHFCPICEVVGGKDSLQIIEIFETKGTVGNASLILTSRAGSVSVPLNL